MRISIVDDLAECREALTECLLRYFRVHYAGETPLIDKFESGDDFLSRFFPETYDLILIDQYMNGLSGMDTARKIRLADPLAVLVFVTTSREHAVDSYSVRASGYLVKPFTYEAFEATVELAGVEKIRSARFFRLQDEKIFLREIFWCDRDGHYTQIHTARRGVLRFRTPFAELEEILSPYPQFLHCYRGCVINLERVNRIDEIDTFLLDSGEQILFSQRNRKKIETAYHTWLFRRTREDDFL